jgi:hypothetical protein
MMQTIFLRGLWIKRGRSIVWSVDYCAGGGPDLSGPLFFPPALAVPAASSMEAAGHAVPKTACVGEPYTMIEAASHAMGEAVAEVMIEAASHAMAEVSAEAGDSCSVTGATGHAMTQAVAEFAVATIVGSVGAIG